MLSVPVIVSILAPIFNLLQLFPQLYKTYTSKRAKDLSIYSLFMMLITTFLWLLHGYFIVDYPIIITGAVNFTAVVMLLIMYSFYGN